MSTSCAPSPWSGFSQFGVVGRPGDAMPEAVDLTGDSPTGAYSEYTDFDSILFGLMLSCMRSCSAQINSTFVMALVKCRL